MQKKEIFFIIGCIVFIFYVNILTGCTTTGQVSNPVTTQSTDDLGTTVQEQQSGIAETVGSLGEQSIQITTDSRELADAIARGASIYEQMAIILQQIESQPTISYYESTGKTTNSGKE